MLQVRAATRRGCAAAFDAAGLGAEFARDRASRTATARCDRRPAGKEIYAESRVELQRAWSETTYQHAAPARQPGLRAAGIRPHPRRRAIRACTRSSRSILPRTSPRRSSATGVRPTRRDPARAGRQRPDGNGGGVRPRRLRRRRRAHERHHRRPRRAWRISRASPRAAASPTATCWARAKAGRSRFCSTRAPATSSRRSSSAATPSRSACATAAR